MGSYFYKSIKNVVQHWYLLLVIGVLFIAVGVYTFSAPLASYLALSYLFSISFLIAGVSEITFAVSNRKQLDSWGWSLIMGIATAIIGMLLITDPTISMVIVPYYVGFTGLFRSLGAVSMALELRRYGVQDWGILLFIGILGVLFSFILLWHPLLAGMNLVFWTALIFIMSGIFSSYLAFKLRRLHHLPKRISAALRERYEAIQREIEQEIKLVR